MPSLDQLTAAGRAKLAAARILLHETQGFLYLPVLVQNQAVAAAALAELLADGPGVSPFVVAWPHLPAATFAAPAPTAKAWEAARAELLANLDHAIAVQAPGAILVLDTSPSDRHRLAVDSVSYLNQRREALRRHQQRLILLWPAGEAQALMSGAPDLWSMRALAPVIDAEDLAANHPISMREAKEMAEAAASMPSKPLSPRQQQQWERWLACRDLYAAQLSTADALALIGALYAQGQWAEVAELSEGVLRQLGKSQAGENQPDLAAGFYWLSLARGEQGDRQGALAPALESVAIREKLAAENYAAYAPDLAASLNNLSIRLAESGDRTGALVASRRSVEMFEKLAAENFAAYADELSLSLNNLSVDLGQNGEPVEGLAAIQRAIDIREKLAAENFVAYASDLAMSLNNLSNLLAMSGDQAGALEAIQRAVEIREKLAAENFAAYASDLGQGLNNLSNCLAESGDQAGALATIRRAVEIREKLASKNFAAYAPDLAMNLGNLSIRLAECGDRAGALVTVKRAIQLITPFALSGTLYEDLLSQMERQRQEQEQSANICKPSS